MVTIDQVIEYAKTLPDYYAPIIFDIEDSPFIELVWQDSDKRLSLMFYPDHIGVYGYRQSTDEFIFNAEVPYFDNVAPFQQQLNWIFGHWLPPVSEPEPEERQWEVPRYEHKEDLFAYLQDTMDLQIEADFMYDYNPVLKVRL